MSKWCGDENCLQCADKEPDPYVHLPRADYDALREQNRVLREALKPFAERWEYFERVPPVNGKEWDYYHCYADEEPSFVYLGQLKAAKAALTATSQPAKPQGRMHACDIPGCVSCGNPEDATSQEEEHESR